MTSIYRSEIINMLQMTGSDQSELHATACRVRNASVSDRVYLRGLVEFSNICVNDCLYCGIRRSNSRVRRYEMSIDDIIEAVDLIAANNITSVVLQSGERHDYRFTGHVTEALGRIKAKYPGIGITLSVGEHEKNVYNDFFEAGAERYLLRIETSDEEHYRKLHPEEMNFRTRIRCLEYIRDAGFQVGTGVMINSPFQTIENLADDILFFKSFGIDMCGMGPFIPHSDTPFADYKFEPEKSLDLGLNMIAALRIVMPDINIAATTALETLKRNGREIGLRAGANVIMPQFSPFKNRGDYRLYDNKPVFDSSPDKLLENLTNEIKRAGMVPEFNDRGDSVYFKNRKS